MKPAIEITSENREVVVKDKEGADVVLAVSVEVSVLSGVGDSVINAFEASYESVLAGWTDDLESVISGFSAEDLDYGKAVGCVIRFK